MTLFHDRTSENSIIKTNLKKPPIFAATEVLGYRKVQNYTNIFLLASRQKMRESNRYFVFLLVSIIPR